VVPEPSILQVERHACHSTERTSPHHGEAGLLEFRG
jgi:hypothetical protein